MICAAKPQLVEEVTKEGRVIRMEERSAEGDFDYE